MQRLLTISLLISTLAALTACGGDDATPSNDDGLTSIPDGFGKSDNYISTLVREYILSGTTAVALPADYADLEASEQESVLEEAVAARTSEVTRAAQDHIEDLVRDANTEVEEEELEYFIYVKPSYKGGEAEIIETDAGLAHFDFEMELVGSNELIELLMGGESQPEFEIEADTPDGEGTETLTITIEASPSTDAFPAYSQLFADGVYDIAIHFGGDYNDERYDLETAKWTVEFLLDSGWQNESVASFDDLRHDSPPFTLPLTVEGEDVEARVYVYHAQMDDDADAEQQLLRDTVEESLEERDVIIYSGHAGSNAGLILDYHPRFELDDKEFDDVKMAEKYQIFVFDGCNSYRTYVDALMKNPAKTFDNTDVVTTVNTTPFSAGYEIINRFVHWLTLTDESGAHFPVSWNTMLRGVNEQYPDVHYGVHGIDQDPKLNPHAGGEFLCTSCSTDADCGGGGNYCLSYDGGGSCGVACTNNAACGDGYECIAITEDPALFYVPKQCVRTNLTCE